MEIWPIDNESIEFCKPDLALAYAIIAPKVSEAYALIHCDKIDEAKAVLNSAMAEMEKTTAMYGMIIVSPVGSSKAWPDETVAKAMDVFNGSEIRKLSF
jgi:hypothetical protein